jgi:hypothetical protein
MNKIKEINKKIKELEGEKKKLEKEESDERIKIGMDYFHSELAYFKQHYFTISEVKEKVALRKEAEELAHKLTDILKQALEKQWKYFEDQKNQKCTHVSFWKAVVEVMMGRKIKD